MTDQYKFEETYGHQVQDKVNLEASIQDENTSDTSQNKTKQTHPQLFFAARWIFIVLLVASGLLLGGIFSVIALTIGAFIFIMSLILSIFTGHRKNGSMTKFP